MRAFAADGHARATLLSRAVVLYRCRQVTAQLVEVGHHHGDPFEFVLRQVLGQLDDVVHLAADYRALVKVQEERLAEQGLVARLLLLLMVGSRLDELRQKVHICPQANLFPVGVWRGGQVCVLSFDMY